MPTAMSSQTIHHGANRTLNHITVIACIAASGEHVIPYIITSQESDDLQRALRSKGVEFERHLILNKSQKSSFNSNSFAEYIKFTFIHHVARIGAERYIQQEHAMFLM
jgi:hypothetical protein